MTPDMLAGGGGPPGAAAPAGAATPPAMDPMLALAQLNRKGRKGPKRHKGKGKKK